MNFDPAIAAQQALARSLKSEELREFHDKIAEAEDTFSSNAGPEAKHAFEELQAIGQQLPEAEAFQEFLIYITWQQVTEETIPQHFQTGLQLCNNFLERFRKSEEETKILTQVLDIRESFQAGLGQQEALIPEFDEDAFKGGD